jgi:hypothetical protein
MSASRVFDINGDIVHAPGLRRAPFKDWLHGIYPDLSVYTSVQHQLSETLLVSLNTISATLQKPSKISLVLPCLPFEIKEMKKHVCTFF